MKPKISVKLENETFKVLEIIGRSGDQINEHKVDHDAIVQMLSGSVNYQEGKLNLQLSDQAIHSIPKQKLHRLEFEKDSKLLLFLLKVAKMEFSNKKK